MLTQIQTPAKFFVYITLTCAADNLCILCLEEFHLKSGLFPSLQVHVARQFSLSLKSGETKRY